MEAGVVALAAPAPESDEVVVLGESLVELFVGDFAVAPFLDLGLGSPLAVAHGEPELAIVAAERDESFGYASEAGDLGGIEE